MTCAADIIDLIVGWSLDSTLPPVLRRELPATLAKFGAMWQEHAEFAATLSAKLLADVQVMYD